MKKIKHLNSHKVIDILENLHDKSGAHFNKWGPRPLKDSKATQDLNSFPKPEMLNAAYMQGSLLIEVAADHLIAFTKTISEPAQTISCWTCVRAIIESGAIASWLLDPNIEARTRTQRSFAFRYNGLEQQRKFVQSLGDEIKTQTALLKIDEVEEKAIELGFERVLDRNQNRIGIAMQMPTKTDLSGEMLSEESSYRLLSAFVHAHGWALQELSFKKVSIENNPYLEKYISPKAILYLCTTAVKAYAKAVWYKNLLFGWDKEALVKTFHSTYDSLGIDISDRFWRNENPSNPA